MKVKFFNFKSLVTYVTIVAFYFATTLSAQALPLRPISLAQMYSLASQGNVRALRAAVQRGMNIDATDRYGNTGLCHSIYQNNYTAYNAFHASGANPRHPCIQNIPPEQYDYFMASSRATPITATPRDAYKEFADGEFVFSTTTWVIGGLLLAGGIAALVIGGSGGGSKNHYYFPTNDSFTPTDDSLGAFVGTNVPTTPATSPYVPVKYDSGVNIQDFTLNNDSQILVDGEQKNLSDVINFNNSVLEYTPYLQVAMKAVDGKQVTNGETPLANGDVGTTITLNNNTVGLAALHNADALNNNTLKIIAKNGTLGMVGSDNSLINNAGNIDISFQGTATTDQVNGMYADTSSSAVNNGNITGNVTSGSAAGTLIGMQGRLINQVQNPENTTPVQLTNNQNISLSATAAQSQTISNSLVGMGSYLENDFLNGTKLVRRTGSVEITNNGKIDLNVNLGDSGTYDTSQVTLYNGTGGIIGIRADAHTNAINNGSINLTIAPESATSVANAHAGMLSVHGGSIKNNKSILVDGGIGGYGMLGIRGEGTNSEFNTLNPTLINEQGATIEVNSVDGFGMATRHGGIVTNLGNILMGENSTGLQINAGTGTNSGFITLNNSGTGMAIRKNTTSEDGTVNNASTATITNNQGGSITINKADGASGMFIEDGMATNNGNISINGTASATTTSSSYGIQAENGTVQNTGNINVDVLMSGDVQSYGIYGGNATQVDNSGTITLAQQGIGTYTASGTNTNSGTITMNANGSTAMSSDSGAITNTGILNLVSGTGIQSTTGQVTNKGNINITDGNGAIGITTSSNILNEENAQIAITGANSTGILIGENGTAVNNGQISLRSNQNSTENYGIKSEGGTNASITNNGDIALDGYNYDITKEVGYGMYIADGQATNNKTISIDEMYGYGMASDAGKVTNNAEIELTNGGYGIQSNTGSVFNSQGATITITGTPTQTSSYGIGVETGTAQNSGTINVSGNTEGTNYAVYGIYVNGGNGINNSIVNMYANNSYGLYDAAGGAITNTSALGQIAEINLFGNNSVGMQTASGKAENFGTINVGVKGEDGTVQGGVDSTAMVAGEDGSAYNTGVINLNGEGATAMNTNGGTVQNTLNGTINVNADGTTVFKTSNGGTAINDGTIVVNANNYELFSSTDEDGGNFINNGGISADSSNSKVIVAGNGTSINNTGNIDLTGSNSYIMYIQGTGTASNSGTLTVGEGSNASYGLYMDSTATESVVNETRGNINVEGTNSAGMYIASANSTNGITNSGTITVSGDGSVGMGSSDSAPITNSGTINMQGGNSAINAAGGVITNTAAGNITAAEDSAANGISIVSGSSAATITNDGAISINGSGNAIMADTATVTNSSTGSINVNSGTGVALTGGSVTNAGTITVSGNGGVGISNGGEVINDESGIISVLGDNAKGMNLTTGGTATNSNTITVSGDNSAGIFVSGGTADNLGTVNVGGDGASGLSIASGSGYNQSTINVSGENAIGITVSNGSAQNGKQLQGEGASGFVNGSIKVTNTGGVGMSVTGSGSILNNQDSTITVNGAQGVGMSSLGTGSATNQGSISVLAEGASGMKASQGSATNTATISVGSANAFGLYADGGNVTNSASGALDISASNGVGIFVNNGTGANNGSIDLSSQGAIGLQANAGSATNAHDLTVNGSGAVGLYAHGGTVTNNGSTITVDGGKAAIWVDAGTGNNSGIINVTAGNTSGMLIAGGTANNLKTINVSGNSSDGMSASAGTATNSGAIDVTGANAVGMSASDSGSANNTSTITVSNATGIGMFADGGSVTNNNTITLTTSGASGMVANSGSALNNSTINASNAGTLAMYANGGKVANGTSGKLNGSTSSQYLMLAENGGTATNQGTLTFNGTLAALQANANSAVNNEAGSITVNGSGASAMIANGSGATASNAASITVNSSAGAGYALLAQNGGTIDNTGSIQYAGTNAAMQANAGSSAQNSGTISATSNNGKGMVASSTGKTAQAINLAGGIINISGANGVGMYADGAGAQAINLGTININTTSANAYGMQAVNGGSVENAGTINMTSGAQGIGIYVGNGSKFYNNASGTISFTGGAQQTGTITADTSSGDVTICESEDTCNNKFIYLAQGASLVNDGTMVTNASFTRSSFGEGDVVLTSNAKMIAKDEIADSYSVASDASMLSQGQKDVYVNENALQANKITANFMSVSPMWKVSLQDSQPETEPSVTTNSTGDKVDGLAPKGEASEEKGDTQIKDIVYERVGFNQLVNNSSQAAYLESNYAIRNSIYDGMIVASSKEDFNRAVQEGLGLDLIPNFAKQNMDIMRNVNRQINSAVFNNTNEDETRTTVGYDFFDREQDGYNGLSGYEDEAHSGYALFDRKYNENFRYGIGASVTKYDSDYDNGSERDEVIAQIMTPLLFEAGNTKLLLMPKVGMGWGEYTRYAQGKEYKADTRNYYYGINNEVRHDVDMGFVTLEPVAEFNVLGFYQNRTKENIRVESNNNVSVEGGLGLYAKKSFSLTGEDELKIRLGGTYYHEFNTPYQAPKAGVVGLLGSYQMDSYDAQKDRAVLSARFDYSRGKFNFYLEGNSYVEDDDTYSINAGLTYAF